MAAMRLSAAVSASVCLAGLAKEAAQAQENQDWHKYVDKYASNYDKYMKEGGGGANQDWHKYIDEYAGKYEKYMKQEHEAQVAQGGMQLAATGGAANSSKSGDDEPSWAKYIPGDAQKYIQQGQGQGGDDNDWHKYVDEYAGDYEKYMHKGGGSAKDDWKKYVKQYAGKYMPDVKNVSDAKEWRDAYMKKYGVEGYKNMTGDDALRKYAGLDFPKDFNSSDDKSWQKYFMDKYAPQYEKYGSKEDHEEHAPSKPSECQTKKELRAWRKASEDAIKDYIPEGTAQDGALKSLDEKFHKNLQRIEAEEAKAAEEAKEKKEEEEKKDEEAKEADEKKQEEEKEEEAKEAEETEAETTPAPGGDDEEEAPAVQLATQPEQSGAPLATLALLGLVAAGAVTTFFLTARHQEEEETPEAYLRLNGV